MSVLSTSTQLSTLSSSPTQIQHLNHSDLSILPATPQQRQYIQNWERRQGKRELEIYFTYNNGEIKTMNQVTHHHKKCVMTLQSSGSSTGSAAWFVPLWNQLSSDDRTDFQSNTGQMLGSTRNDFFVHRERSGQNRKNF